MKRFNIIYAGLTVAAAAFACSCSDSDNWTPGPADTDTGVVAYFDQPGQTSYIFDVEQPASEIYIDVTVGRHFTADAVTIPLTVDNAVTGISVPSSISFAAGEPWATFKVDCSGIEAGKQVTFTIMLPDDQTDIYGDGLNDVTFSVIKSNWVPVSDNVRYVYSDLSYNPIYPSTTDKKLYRLEGTDMFRFEDFFGSGLSVMFEASGSDYSVLTPLNNAYFEPGDPDNMWYLYDEANDYWPAWVPGDVEGYPAISYLEFFATSDYSWGSMIYDEETLYGYFGFSAGVTFDDGSFSWGSFQIDFNFNTNPF